MPFAVALLCHPARRLRVSRRRRGRVRSTRAHTRRFVPAFTAASAALLTTLAFLQVPPERRRGCIGSRRRRAAARGVPAADVRRRAACSGSAAARRGARGCCSPPLDARSHARRSASRSRSRHCVAARAPSARTMRLRTLGRPNAAHAVVSRYHRAQRHRGGNRDGETLGARARQRRCSWARAGRAVGGRRRHGADHGRELGARPRARQAVRREGLDRHRDAPPRRRARVAGSPSSPSIRTCASSAWTSRASTEVAGAGGASSTATPIDVLINNAGIYSDRAACGDEACRGEDSTQSFGELDYELFDTIMAVNVRGPLLVSEAFIEHVRASRQKKIVSISSTNGSITFTLGGSGAIAYRASKAALNRAMQLVAVHEQNAGVTVLLLHPGAVLTERQAHLTFPGMIQMQPSVDGHDRADREGHDRGHGAFHSIRRRDGALVTARSRGERSMKTTLAIGNASLRRCSRRLQPARRNPRSPTTSRRSPRSTSAICDRSTRKTSRR